MGRARHDAFRRFNSPSRGKIQVIHTQQIQPQNMVEKNKSKENPDQSQDNSHSKRRYLLPGIVIGIVLGVIIGGFLPSLAAKIGILGDIFLNALMMLVVPLVIFSMITGITGLGRLRNLGSLGWRTVLYYLMTTSIAVMIGLIMVNLIQPGVGISPGEQHPEQAYRLQGSHSRTVVMANGAWQKRGYGDKYAVALLDQNVRGMIESISDSTATVKLWQNLKPVDRFYITADDGTRLPFRRVDGELISAEPEVATSGVGVEITLPIAEKVRGKEEGNLGSTLKEVLVGNEESGKQGMIPRNIFAAMAEMDILPLIVFSLLFGAALMALGKQAGMAAETISKLNDAVMQLVNWVMLLTPVGVFGLVAARIGEAGGFSGFLPELLALGKYSLTVLLSLAIHGFVILPLILKFLGRRQPWKYAKGVGAALLNALSTASSSATLPLTLRGVEEENEVSNRTASFVLPLGATVNMDGTAMYEAVAAIFIAQVYGISLSAPMQLVIFLTATLAAIGAAGIPEAGLVTMVIVLRAVGLPIEGIGLLLAIDWLLDRFRTTVNVWGDSIGAGVIETFEMRAQAQAT